MSQNTRKKYSELSAKIRKRLKKVAALRRSNEEFIEMVMKKRSEKLRGD